MTCCVQGTGLSRDSVYPEVGGYGIRPVSVTPAEGGNYLVHFKLPPGLAAGWHEVSLGAGGNSTEIAVDVDAAADHIEIQGACDGVSWQPFQVSLANGFLSLWVEGLPRNADIANVRVEVGAQRQLVTFVGPPGANGVRQVNARVERCGQGASDVSVSFGDVRSAGIKVQFDE